MHGLHRILLAASLALPGPAAALGAPAPAPARAPARAYDPQQLPATRGRVVAYSLTPRGDVNGLLLDDGTQVHLPPHLGPLLVLVAKPGDAVTVRGLRSRAIPLVQAMQVVNDATGQSVVDTGPPASPSGQEPGPRIMERQGVVKAVLYGPMGDMNGALLDDGTQVFLPPPEAQRLSALLAPGTRIAVRGIGTESQLGRAIEVQAIGPAGGQLERLASPPLPPAAPNRPGAP